MGEAQVGRGRAGKKPALCREGHCSPTGAALGTSLSRPCPTCPLLGTVPLQPRDCAASRTRDGRGNAHFGPRTQNPNESKLPAPGMTKHGVRQGWQQQQHTPRSALTLMPCHTEKPFLKKTNPNHAAKTKDLILHQATRTTCQCCHKCPIRPRLQTATHGSIII